MDALPSLEPGRRASHTVLTAAVSLVGGHLEHLPLVGGISQGKWNGRSAVSSLAVSVRGQGECCITHQREAPGGPGEELHRAQHGGSPGASEEAEGLQRPGAAAASPTAWQGAWGTKGWGLVPESTGDIPGPTKPWRTVGRLEESLENYIWEKLLSLAPDMKTDSYSLEHHRFGGSHNYSTDNLRRGQQQGLGGDRTNRLSTLLCLPSEIFNCHPFESHRFV